MAFTRVTFLHCCAWQWALLSAVALLCTAACGEADPICLKATAAAHTAQAQAQAHSSDANLRASVTQQLDQMLADGQLRGRGIWQRGAVRRKGQKPPLALMDDAQQGVVDGWTYQAFVTAPPPRLASIDDPDCEATRTLSPCGAIGAHSHVVLERTGGIAGRSFRTDAIIAYQQDADTYLCACPPSTLTERLPLCCAWLCCR